MKSIVFALLFAFLPNQAQQANPGKVRTALRDVGHTLLLQNQDSSTLVMPITQMDENRFELPFEKPIKIVPDSLVHAIKRSFKMTGQPNSYLVEVISNSAKKVVYSFQISGSSEKDVIPCLGRNLPLDNYSIQVVFPTKGLFNKLYLNVFGVLIFCSLGIYMFRKKNKKTSKENVSHETYIAFGRYQFYENQSKVKKKDMEIKLTPKETQLLKIFITNPNEVIKRERLIKEVWEDNGVIVGRSLDAFISKIRKKFEFDESVNIINFHGVGYKLEILSKR